MGELLVLGLTLSLDNFRTSILLGGLRLSRRHAVQVALMFGFWDGVAPLVGILIGAYLAERIASTPEYIGAIALGAYGLYLVVQAWRTPTADQIDQRWVLFGLPLPLSIDNVVAGASLGLLGYSPWLAPPLFGGITAVMSFIGLQIGAAAARFIRIRADLLTGVGLIVMAIVMGLGLVEG